MNSRFKKIDTSLPGLVLMERQLMGDTRGWLERIFCNSELADLLEGRSIAQINRTHTTSSGTVRGMHFQKPPHAEMKIVACLLGEVFDVAVDLRPGSSTRYHWHGEILSDKNHKTLVIPEGFAHGFQTLTTNCEMLYLHSTAYHPQSEAGFNPRDPLLAIKWPLPITEISERDAAHPFITPS